VTRVSVLEVVEHPSKYLGRTIELCGTFTYSADGALMYGSEGDLRGRAIRVVHGDLPDILFGKVPAYGGSKYLYRDKAMLVGIIDVASDGVVEISDICDMRLVCDGECTRVI